MSRFGAVTAPGARALGLTARRLRGRFDVDEWGLDPELIDFFDPLVGLRWDIQVDGAEALPSTGGALLLHNQGLGFSERWVLARGVREARGRFVRTTGLLDIAPIGPLLRRFGAVVDDETEIGGLLRAGQLVGVPLRRDGSGLAPHCLGLAHDAGVPIVPVALIGHEIARRWRIVIGRPIAPTRSRERSEAAVETAGETVAAMVADARSTSWWR